MDTAQMALTLHK